MLNWTLYFFILLLTIVISAPECSAYFCSEIEIEQDICIISHVSAHEIKKCPKDFYCNKYSKKCEQSDNQVAFPGNKCTTKQFCLGSCESGICRGLHKGESCKNHIDCDPHLMCYNGSCRPKVSQHQSCYKDFECPNDMFCHNNKCAKYFSLPRDEVIDICHEYESKKCASGMCQQNRCMDELVVPRKSNIPCVSSFCEIESGEHTWLTECSCGHTFSRESFCGLLVTDPEKAEMRNLWRLWVSSDGIHNCNTHIRFDLSCVKDWEYELYQKLLHFDVLNKNFAGLQNIEECVQERLFPQLISRIERTNNSLRLGLILESLLFFFI